MSQKNGLGDHSIYPTSYIVNLMHTKIVPPFGIWLEFFPYNMNFNYFMYSLKLFYKIVVYIVCVVSDVYL